MKQEWENPKEDVQTRFAFYIYKDEPDVIYLSNVFVEESSRHQGLGTKILKAAEMVAKTYGATIIRLRVKSDSPAKAWYLNHGYIYMTFEGEYQWLEKYLSKANQKPVGWSEEDEEMFNLAKLAIWEGERLSQGEAGRVCHWIKNRCQQPKFEWNEEDEKKLNTIIEVLEHEECDKLIDWIKSKTEILSP